MGGKRGYGGRYLYSRRQPAAELLQADTFSDAIDAFIADLDSQLIPAGRHVDDAEARVQAVTEGYDAIEDFRARVERHLQRGTFGRLPQIIDSETKQPIAHLHKLTVGPLEGAFLVKADGTQVIGLVFSHEPHHYLDKLGDLLVTYAKANG